MRRVRELPAHLEWVRQPRRHRDRRRQQPRGGRRPRPARARDVLGLAGGALQGLHRRRSAHAHPRGVERAAQDPRGTAAAGRLRLRDHRPAEDRRHGGPGPVPPAAVRLPAHRARGHPGAAPRRAGRRGHRRGRRCPDAHRAARGRRHARRALRAGPVPELRRRRGDRRPGSRDARPRRRRAVRRGARHRGYPAARRGLPPGGPPDGIGRRSRRVPERHRRDAACAAHGAGGRTSRRADRGCARAARALPRAARRR